MKTNVIRSLALVGALVVGLAARPDAQLLQPNADGLSMGLVMLNVTDVAAHTRFWVDEFDAKPVKAGTPRPTSTVNGPDGFRMWGATIRLTEGLGQIAGVASFKYTDPFLERR